MSPTWSSYFSFNKKPDSTNTISPLLTAEKDTLFPLCCPSLSHYALLQTPTYWLHAPKYQNRLKDFLSWIDTTTSSLPENESWVDVASYTDVDKADFVFMILTDSGKAEEKIKVFIPLHSTTGTDKTFSQIGHENDFLQLNHKDYVSTGNMIRLVCPVCKEGFKITLLHKKGRSIDIQLCDIRDLTMRKGVEQMKRVYPEWRYDDLRGVLLMHHGAVREAMEEAKNKNAARDAVG
jgi:hypothetical protein